MKVAHQIPLPSIAVSCGVAGCPNRPVVLIFPDGVPACVVHEERLSHAHARGDVDAWRTALEVPTHA